MNVLWSQNLNLEKAEKMLVQELLIFLFGMKVCIYQSHVL